MNPDPAPEPAIAEAIEPAALEFDAHGNPWSARYGDVYHPADGALGQARHVFLGGNHLPDRWHACERFVIVETGFGTGLNFLAAWSAFAAHAPAQARLHYVSVEKHPFGARDLARIHERWSELEREARALRAAWPPLLAGFHRLHLERERVTLTLLFGDAARMLARLEARADAFFLDGFAPDRNPEPWSEAVCRQIARLARPGATLATWTVAGAVRARLAAAGFHLEKRAGFGSKREMLIGYDGRPAGSPARPPRHAVVIGAGMAGTCCAQRLAARGWRVDIVDRREAPACEASGNPTGVLLPLINLSDTPGARLSRACLLYAGRHFAGLPDSSAYWNACGVLQLARDDLDPERHARVLSRRCFPEDFARNVSAEVAAGLAGWPVAAPGWWFSFGGWLRPGRACEANLLAYPERIVRHFGRGVERLRRTAGGWSIEDAAGREICAAPRVILANANDAARVAPLSCIPLKAARGQITYLAEDARRRLHVPVCRRGYITPASGGFHCIGATFDRDQEPRARAADHAINLARLHATLPGFADSVDPERLAGRVAFRATTPDRLPVIGLLPPGDADRADPPDGIYLLTGLGARGLVWAPLAAELLASELETEPSPVEGALVRAVDPARFAARRRPVQRITNAS